MVEVRLVLRNERICIRPVRLLAEIDGWIGARPKVQCCAADLFARGDGIVAVGLLGFALRLASRQGSAVSGIGALVVLDRARALKGGSGIHECCIIGREGAIGASCENDGRC